MKSEAHKQEMVERRARQLARTEGFIPVRNAKIEARIQAQTGLLTLAYQNAPGPMPSGADIQAEATRAVARTLPATPIGVRVRPYRNTSKYNQQNTRGKR